jgi:hypothetical protein
MKHLEYINETEKIKYFQYKYFGEKYFIDKAIEFLQEAKEKGYEFTNIDFNNFKCSKKLNDTELKELKINMHLEQIKMLQEEIEQLKNDL